MKVETVNLETKELSIADILRLSSKVNSIIKDIRLLIRNEGIFLEERNEDFLKALFSLASKGEKIVTEFDSKSVLPAVKIVDKQDNSFIHIEFSNYDFIEYNEKYPSLSTYHSQRRKRK